MVGVGAGADCAVSAHPGGLLQVPGAVREAAGAGGGDGREQVHTGGDGGEQVHNPTLPEGGCAGAGRSNNAQTQVE